MKPPISKDMAKTKFMLYKTNENQLFQKVTNFKKFIISKNKIIIKES